MRFQRLAKHAFAVAAAIKLEGVNEVYPKIQRPPQRIKASLIILRSQSSHR